MYLFLKSLQLEKSFSRWELVSSTKTQSLLLVKEQLLSLISLLAELRSLKRLSKKKLRMRTSNLIRKILLF
jgi:hypothetical protein